MFIENKKKGVDVAQITEDAADDTFVKILEGTNIFDLKARGDGSGDDELMGSEFELADDYRMATALDGDRAAPKVQPLDISKVNLGTDANLKLPGDQHEEKNKKKFEVISNRRNPKTPREDEAVANTIDSKTKSMLNAMQGRSIFQSHDESMF